MTDTAPPNPTSPDRDAIARANRQFIELARRSLIEDAASIEVVEGGSQRPVRVTRRGVGPIKTPHAGEFFLFDFHVDDEWQKYSVLFKGSLGPRLEPIIVDHAAVSLRIDSGCETGQVFGDGSCECGAQLHAALEAIDAAGFGFLVSIPGQDGRGMGLPFKLATLTIQTELGFDTVHAAFVLDPSGERDRRTYAGVVAILRFLGVSPPTTVNLMSNNPGKANALRENGYPVTSVPLTVGVTPQNLHHLKAKRDYLGHGTLDLPPDSEGSH
jgi:3,4-dihydroxy 2-butanone 4-phosphate synthase/GTP cyclohydrolase II